MIALPASNEPGFAAYRVQGSIQGREGRQATVWYFWVGAFVAWFIGFA
jgi:hypothetical protein